MFILTVNNTLFEYVYKNCYVYHTINNVVDTLYVKLLKEWNVMHIPSTALSNYTKFELKVRNILESNGYKVHKILVGINSIEIRLYKDSMKLAIDKNIKKQLYDIYIAYLGREVEDIAHRIYGDSLVIKADRNYLFSLEEFTVILVGMAVTEYEYKVQLNETIRRLIEYSSNTSWIVGVGRNVVGMIFVEVRDSIIRHEGLSEKSVLDILRKICRNNYPLEVVFTNETGELTPAYNVGNDACSSNLDFMIPVLVTVVALFFAIPIFIAKKYK